VQVPMSITERLRFNEDLAVRPATFSFLHKGKCHGVARHHEIACKGKSGVALPPANTRKSAFCMLSCCSFCSSRQATQENPHVTDTLGPASQERPAWLPPASGSPRHAVAQWWEAQRAAPSQTLEGFARCWWAQPGAAERGGSEGAAWRAAAEAALRRRALLPALLAGALAGNATESVGALKGAASLRHKCLRVALCVSH